MDEIDGIGEKTVMKLINHFGSVKKIKEASSFEIVKMIGLKKYEKLILNLNTKKNCMRKKFLILFLFPLVVYSQKWTEDLVKIQIKTSMKYKKSSINIGKINLMKKVKFLETI